MGKHDIHKTGNTLCIAVPPYRLSHGHRQQFAEKLVKFGRVVCEV